ncbi:MAG: transcription-repair coupling factor, partial [Candidatus Phosphoribacter sp.]
MSLALGSVLAGLPREFATRHTGLGVLVQAARDRELLVDIAAPTGVRPFVLPLLLPAGIVLAVTATTREAEDLAAALGESTGQDAVAVFPSWETLPHERLSPRSDTVGRRLAVLRRLANPDPHDATRGPLRVADPGLR